MRFFCPHCKKTRNDSVALHYVFWHIDVLEARYTQQEIADMVDTAINPPTPKKYPLFANQFVDTILTAVQILAKVVLHPRR